jgi:type I restriction enzyme M protein
MFVQTGHFIEHVRHAKALDAVTFHGQEKSDTNTKLARMNLVVHGLDASNIRQGNTFYDQVEHLIGQCDFVMANPPFNVDGVDTKRIVKQVAPQTAEERAAAGQGSGGYRLPFGLPGTNAKTGAVSNANGLWIQYFYSYLNGSGRAGFVMASSASDAGNKDREIREKLVKTGHVDVMLAIGTKFFYTRSLPCTLWFFDKGKPEDLRDQVLMIDARHVYHVVSARSHVFTDEQLANLTAITWLYRGEREKFTGLVARYQRQADGWLACLPERMAADDKAVAALAEVLAGFAEKVSLAELNAEVPEEARVTSAALAAWKEDWAKACAEGAPAGLAEVLTRVAEVRRAVAGADLDAHAGQKALQAQLDGLAVALKAAGKGLEARHKRWLGLLEGAEKSLRARASKAWDGKAAVEAKRALLSGDVKKGAVASVRDRVLEALKQAVYFIGQVHWLHSRFADGLYEDVPGLCKAVSVEDIEANDWSLTPGRYVGVATQQTDDDEDKFAEQLRDIHAELADLNEKAAALAVRIAGNLEELLG